MNSFSTRKGQNQMASTINNMTELTQANFVTTKLDFTKYGNLKTESKALVLPFTRKQTMVAKMH